MSVCKRVKNAIKKLKDDAIQKLKDNAFRQKLKKAVVYILK